METKQAKRNTLHLVGDAAMTVFSIAILAITFYGVSAMTPQPASSITAQKNSSVLGEKSSNAAALTFFPQPLGSLQYVQNSSFESNVQLTNNATSTISFTALAASTYTLSPLSIKNTGTTSKVVVITPTYSVDGSYTTISLNYDGQLLVLVDAKGTVTPAEIVVDPNTLVPVTIVVQPTTPLQVPPTLTLGFTEKP